MNKSTIRFVTLAFVSLSAVAACSRSFNDGFDGAKCANESKDEATCASCCTTKVPDGKEGKWESGACVCVLKNGTEIRKH